jgi:hypothetical protein
LPETISEDGEIITTAPLAEVDHGMATALAVAEIDTLISTARKYPRMLSTCQQRMFALATMDEDSADEAIYSLPRGGKALEGPSIRFAEMAAQAYGNCRVAARVTAVDRREKFVEAEGVFLDAETNVATLARVRRRIVDSKGRLYNDDMVLVTSNAAQSIARRNAILAGIPKSVWSKAYAGARQVVMGDITTLANRRAEAITAFQRFGITAEQLFTILGAKGEEDIDQEKLVSLRSSFKHIRAGEMTVEEFMRGGSAASEPAKAAVENPFKDDPIEKELPADAAPSTAKDAAAASSPESAAAAPKAGKKNPLRDLGEATVGDAL